MRNGTFIRVKANHPDESRAGKDGMVVDDFGEAVALVFYCDRHNVVQRTECVGAELWQKTELDLSTTET
jgi:hypothetical protein